MLMKKPVTDADTFWKEYEEKIGEKVLARCLGRYMSGWGEFEEKAWSNIWGLIIATETSLRFHHFPQHNWVSALSRNYKEPKEKAFTLPRGKIISAELVKENNWFLKLLKSTVPRLVVNYTDDSGAEKKLSVEADLIHGNLVEILNSKSPLP